MSSRRLEIVQGDDRRIFVPVRDQDGETVDISGAQSIEAAVARSLGGTAEVTKTLAGSDIVITGSNDEFYFDLTAADTGGLSPAQYWLEAEIVTSGGLTYTVAQVPLTIKAQIITGA